MNRWTKRDVINKAYAASGLASYDFDLSPEEYRNGLMSLDAMMMQWELEGIRPGYNRDGGLDDNCGIEDTAYRATYTNLAIELAASIGRQVAVEIMAMAERGYQALLASVAEPIPKGMEDVPTGAGNRGIHGGWGPRFINDEEDTVEAGPGSELEFK